MDWTGFCRSSGQVPYEAQDNRDLLPHNGPVKGLVRRKALRKPFGMDCMRTGFWVRVLGSGCYNDYTVPVRG